MAPFVFCLRSSGPRLRWGTLLGVVLAVLLGCVRLYFTDSFSLDFPGIMGLGLHFRNDGFRSLYALLASFMWLISGMLSPQYFHHDHHQGRYLFFNLLTLGATLGVFFSDDLYTTLVFFEIMSLASYVWVVQEEEPAAMRAGQTYLAVAVIGGLTTLMGLFLLYRELGTLSFDGLLAARRQGLGSSGTITAATWLTLFGFAAKAGLFPLHIWLPKAHPVAPAPASALLSGMLTKTGIFGLIVICSRLMPGDHAFGRMLLILGSITMFLGALLALFSVNLKRTLACSSVSQIGFITVGLATAVLLGHHGTLAAYGSILHMVNHSLIKLCLFLSAGCVFMNLEELDLNRIRGFGRRKPFLHAVFLCGGLALACIPPFGSGYNSKSLLHEGLLEYIAHSRETGGSWMAYKAIEILFLISGGLTIAYMIKLYVCIFHEKNPSRQTEFDQMTGYASPLSRIALAASCIMLPLFGLMGSLMTPFAVRSMPFFGFHPLTHPIFYFSLENLKGAMESLVIGLAVYFLIVRRFLMRKTASGTEYVNRWPAWLDLENSVYRPVLHWLPTLLSVPDRLIMGYADSALIRQYIPRFVSAVVSFVASLPESRLIKDWIPRACMFITRFLVELPEIVVYFSRRTIFHFRKTRKPVPVGTRVTYALGTGLNRIVRILNRTLLIHHPLREDYEYVLDASHEEAHREVEEIGHSVSYGLLLLVLGLTAVILILLFQQ